MHPSHDIPTVTRFEADLLSILQGFLGRFPRSQLLVLLSRKQSPPPCLSKTCIALVEDTLAKGATLLVARDAWQEETYLREDRAVTGRLWERTTPGELGLTFSRQSLSFLIWATANDVGQRGDAWSFHLPLELGDRWLLVTAFGALYNSRLSPLWAERHPWRGDAFCRLLYATDFDSMSTRPLDFAPWLTPAGCAVLEASQAYLAARWCAMEQDKARLPNAHQLRAAAASQTQVLEAFLDAIDLANRRDLARFLLVAGERLLLSDMHQAAPAHASQRELRLADRQQALRDMQVVPQHFSRLTSWQAESRRIGYFDEGYQAAQLWKRDWEMYRGDEQAAAAHRLAEHSQWV